MAITLRQFRKYNPDLKGKKIYLCEHLKNKTIDNVNVNLWIGENTRLLLCPICTRVHTTTVWDVMFSHAMFIMEANKLEQASKYGEWLEKAGKEDGNG